MNRWDMTADDDTDSRIVGAPNGGSRREPRLDLPALYNHRMGLLWFRRSRRNDARQEPQIEPPAPPLHQMRVPLRLRGLLLLKLKPGDGPDHIEKAPALGGRDHVIRALQSQVPGLTFDADGRGEVVAADHRLTLDIGGHAQVHAAVASAEGDTGVELLRSILEREGWRAYAPRAGVFIEPDALDLFALPDDVPPQSRL